MTSCQARAFLVHQSLNSSLQLLSSKYFEAYQILTECLQICRQECSCLWSKLHSLLWSFDITQKDYFDWAFRGCLDHAQFLWCTHLFLSVLIVRRSLQHKILIRFSWQIWLLCLMLWDILHSHKSKEYYSLSSSFDHYLFLRAGQQVLQGFQLACKMLLFKWVC